MTGSDVRQKTLFLVTLTRPQSSTVSNGRPVRFSWGSFLFNGCIDSLGETIDLFSPDGVPLRATVALSLRGISERDARPASGAAAAAGATASAGVGIGASVGAIGGASFGGSASAGASFGATAGAAAGATAAAGASFAASADVGTTPLTITGSGDTIQSLAARAGVSWKALAAANGIANPLALPVGTVLDIRVGR